MLKEPSAGIFHELFAFIGLQLGGWRFEVKNKGIFHELFDLNNRRHQLEAQSPLLFDWNTPRDQLYTRTSEKAQKTRFG